jgi:hypothetical protein
MNQKTCNLLLLSQMLKLNEDTLKGISAGSFLALAVLFLSIGDAFNGMWFTLFFENLYTYCLVMTIFVYKSLKSKIIKLIFEVVMLYFSFYIIFNIAILFKPFESYSDFTSNPVICAQILWGLVGFAIIQINRR